MIGKEGEGSGLGFSEESLGSYRPVRSLARPYGLELIHKILLSRKQAEGENRS